MTRRGRGAVIQFYREFLRIGGCRNALVAHFRRAARAVLWKIMVRLPNSHLLRCLALGCMAAFPELTEKETMACARRLQRPGRESSRLGS